MRASSVTRWSKSRLAAQGTYRSTAVPLNGTGPLPAPEALRASATSSAMPRVT